MAIQLEDLNVPRAAQLSIDIKLSATVNVTAFAARQKVTGYVADELSRERRLSGSLRGYGVGVSGYQDLLYSSRADVGHWRIRHAGAKPAPPGCSASAGQLWPEFVH